MAAHAATKPRINQIFDPISQIVITLDGEMSGTHTFCLLCCNDLKTSSHEYFDKYKKWSKVELSFQLRKC